MPALDLLSIILPPAIQAAVGFGLIEFARYLRRKPQKRNPPPSGTEPKT